MSISTSSLAALGTYDAQSLVTPNVSQQHLTQKNATSSSELETLRLQLQEKTRELQEYKSQLFRSSHPQDQAKIVELSRRIAEYEKAKQKLNADIQALEKELQTARNQIQTLESSSAAFSALIQGQRIIVDVEKQELQQKLHAYEQDKSFENERRISEQLKSELAVLNQQVASSEKRLKEMQENHDSELQDILQEATMLKFELADIRNRVDEKANKFTAYGSNLPSMPTAAKDQTKSSNKSLNEVHDDLALLKALITEITSENLRLESENDLLNEKMANNLINLDQFEEKTQSLAAKLIEKEEALTLAKANNLINLDQSEEKTQSLAAKLIEKEEALTLAKANYQKNIDDQARHLEALKLQLAAERQTKEQLTGEKELVLAQSSVESHVLENKIGTAEETIEKSIADYQAAISDYLSEVAELKEKLEIEESMRLQLQLLNDQLAMKHDVERHVLAAMVAEHGDALDGSLLTYQMTISDYMSEIQMLKEKLDVEESLRLQLQQIGDQIAAQEDVEKHVLKTSIEEHKDSMDGSLLSYQMAISDYLSELQQVQADLEKEREMSNTLRLERDVLLSQHDIEKSVLENALVQKEQDLAAAIAMSQATFNDSIGQTEALKQRVADADEARLNLLKAHEELSEHHSAKTSELSQYHSEKQSLEGALKEKEEALDAAILIAQGSISEHLLQIQTLNEMLAIEEKARTQLQQLYDDLAAEHGQTKEVLALQDQEKHSFGKTLGEKEEALESAIGIAKITIDEHVTQIEALTQKLANEEQNRKELQQAHEELATQHAEIQQALSKHSEEKQEIERTLKEKEELISTTLSSTQNASSEFLAKIEDLKEQIANEQEIRMQLQEAHEELANLHSNVQQSLDKHKEEKQDLLSALEVKEKTIESMGSTSSSSQDQLAQIEALKQKLAEEEEARRSLQQAHEELASLHASVQQTLEGQEEEKQQRVADIQAKDDTIANANRTAQEQLVRIEALESRLALQEQNEEQLAQLQKAHEELAEKYSQVMATVEQNNSDKEELIRSLAEKDAAIEKARKDLQSASGAQSEQLAELQNAHEDLTAQYSQLLLTIENHQSDKEEMARALAEKDAALEKSHEGMQSASGAQAEQLAKLQNAHEELTAQYSQLLLTTEHHQSDKEEMARALAEKDAALEKSHEGMQSASGAQSEQLAKLQDNLSQQEQQYAALQREHASQKEELSKLEEQLIQTASLQRELQELAGKHSNEMQRVAALEEQLQSLSSEKENEFYKTTLHAQNLETANGQLSDALTKAQAEANDLKERISAIEVAASTKDSQLENHHAQTSTELSQMRNQLDDDRMTIESLKQDIEKITASFEEKVQKEAELERGIQSLTVVAQHQDQALAEANSTFSMVQEYNHQLENENVTLRNRLSQMETAQRESGKSNDKDVVGERTPNVLSPALLNLLQRLPNQE